MASFPHPYCEADFGEFQGERSVGHFSAEESQDRDNVPIWVVRLLEIANKTQTKAAGFPIHKLSSKLTSTFLHSGWVCLSILALPFIYFNFLDQASAIMKTTFVLLSLALIVAIAFAQDGRSEATSVEEYIRPYVEVLLLLLLRPSCPLSVSSFDSVSPCAVYFNPKQNLLDDYVLSAAAQAAIEAQSAVDVDAFVGANVSFRVRSNFRIICCFSSVSLSFLFFT